MANSSEQIHINKRELERTENNSNPAKNTIIQTFKNTVDDIHINLETPAQNNQINSHLNFLINEKKENGTENTEKQKPKKSKQVNFDSEKDKVIVVENWKRFNGVKQKFCKCTLI